MPPTASSQAPSLADPIEIDSDDECGRPGEDATQQPLACWLILPQAKASNTSNPHHDRTGTAEDRCVVMRQEATLEISHEGSNPIIPIMSVVAENVASIEVLQDESIVQLTFESPVFLIEPLPLKIAGTRCIAHTTVPHSTVQLQPCDHAACRAMLPALRRWFPNIVVKLPQGAASNGHTVIPRGRLIALDADFALRLDGIELRAHELDLLGEEKFLNDSVIDFFLKLIVDVVAPPNLRNDLHVTSSFFFSKLTAAGVTNGEEGWENVQRWTRAMPNGLLSQKFIAVPVNEQNIHWWLAVVCHPRTALEGAAPAANAGESSRIVCLDSAVEPPPKGRTMGFLRGYLWREWCERHEAAAASLGHAGQTSEQQQKVKIERAMAMKAVIGDVPKQANGYDCGIFLIEYILHLIKSRSALASLGLAPHQHWFGQAVVSHRRKRLRAIAAYLRQEAQKRSEPDVGKLLKDARLRALVSRALQDHPKQGKKRPGPADEAGDTEGASSRGAGPGEVRLTPPPSKQRATSGDDATRERVGGDNGGMAQGSSPRGRPNTAARNCLSGTPGQASSAPPTARAAPTTARNCLSSFG